MNEINFEQARFNMVEQQIRTWEVLDQKVLDVIMATPRDEFVPSRFRNLAYADITIPLEHGQQMMFPKHEARLLQSLSVKDTETVLEVGTGSGYLTALLAKLAKHVYSVEIYPDLMSDAARRLKAHDIQNVTLEEGDASGGWEDHAPYDAIALTGSLPELPEAFKHNLSVGGRLFAIIGEAPVMEAILVTRVGQSEWTRQSLFETEVPPLIHRETPQRFIF